MVVRRGEVLWIEEEENSCSFEFPPPKGFGGGRVNWGRGMEEDLTSDDDGLD